MRQGLNDSLTSGGRAELTARELRKAWTNERTNAFRVGTEWYATARDAFGSDTPAIVNMTLLRGIVRELPADCMISLRVRWVESGQNTVLEGTFDGGSFRVLAVGGVWSGQPIDSFVLRARANARKPVDRYARYR